MFFSSSSSFYLPFKSLADFEVPKKAHMYNVLHIHSVGLFREKPSYSVQSAMFDSVTPWTAAQQVSLSITNSQSLLKLMSIQLVMPSNHLMLCHTLLLLPSIFSSIRVFSNESVLYIRWPKYWHFSFLNTHLPMNTQDWFLLEWTGWISLQSKGLSRVFSNTTVKKKLFSAQLSLFWLSHPYMTTGKTTALTRWTFLGKVMSLLLNMLSRLVIAFLPRSKRLLMSWLQSPSAMILEPKKAKSLTVSSSIFHEVMGPDAMVLVFLNAEF